MTAVLYQIRDHIALVTLNRPERLNSINQEMRDDLFRIFTDVRDNPEVWVTVVTGAGRAFCTGRDLSELGKGEEGTGPTTDDLYIFQLGIWKPFIAAINGYCLAQGAGIALCSDIRIASTAARFGWPQAKRGIGSISGPCLLAHRIPLNYALEFLLTGEFVDAQEAHRLNLVNRVVSPESLLSTAQAMAEKIRENAPLALRAMKEVTLRGLGMSLEERVRFARLMVNQVEHSEDAHEGLRAFAEKRPAVWKGR